MNVEIKECPKCNESIKAGTYVCNHRESSCSDSIPDEVLVFSDWLEENGKPIFANAIRRKFLGFWTAFEASKLCDHERFPVAYAYLVSKSQMTRDEKDLNEFDLLRFGRWSNVV